MFLSFVLLYLYYVLLYVSFFLCSRGIVFQCLSWLYLHSISQCLSSSHVLSTVQVLPFLFHFLCDLILFTSRRLSLLNALLFLSPLK